MAIRKIHLFMIVSILLIVSCNGKGTEKKKGTSSIGFFTKQVNVTNVEGQKIDTNIEKSIDLHISMMTNQLKRTPLYEMKSEEVSNIGEIKARIDQEYTNYDIIYTGLLGERRIILIGKRYPHKSCLRWGAFYDITDTNILRIGEFNDEGRFFYEGDDVSAYDITGDYMYVVMFRKNYLVTDLLENMARAEGMPLKYFLNNNPEYKEDISNTTTVLITESYLPILKHGLVYNTGDIWWYSQSVKEWRCLASKGDSKGLVFVKRYLEGKWVNSLYLRKLKQTKSPIKAAQGLYEVYNEITKKAHSYQWLRVYDFHEATRWNFTNFMSIVANHLQPIGLNENSGNIGNDGQPSFVFSMISRNMIETIEGGKRRQFERINEDISLYVNKQVLAGRYTNAQGKLYEFTDDEIAKWPNKSFKYEIGLDWVFASIDYFQISDEKMTSYCFEHSNDNVLYLYKPVEDSDVIEKKGEPIEILYKLEE